MKYNFKWQQYRNFELKLMRILILFFTNQKDSWRLRAYNFKNKRGSLEKLMANVNDDKSFELYLKGEVKKLTQCINCGILEKCMFNNEEFEDENGICKRKTERSQIK